MAQGHSVFHGPHELGHAPLCIRGEFRPVGEVAGGGQGQHGRVGGHGGEDGVGPEVQAVCEGPIDRVGFVSP